MGLNPKSLLKSLFIEISLYCISLYCISFKNPLSFSTSFTPGFISKRELRSMPMYLG